MFALPFVAISLIAQQSASQLTKNQFDGFKYMFAYLTRSDLELEPPADRMANIASQFRLDEAEKVALQAAAEGYRQTVSAFVAEPTPQQAAQQVQARDKTIRSLAAIFLGQLSTVRGQRILDHFEDPSRID